MKQVHTSLAHYCLKWKEAAYNAALGKETGWSSKVKGLHNSSISGRWENKKKGNVNGYDFDLEAINLA